jgi:prepilin-type processing-associated H-X9-DG protein
MKDSDINPTQVTEQKTADKLAFIGMILGIASVLFGIGYFIFIFYLFKLISLSAPDKALIAFFLFLGALLWIPAFIVSRRSLKKINNGSLRKSKMAIAGELTGSLGGLIALWALPFMLFLSLQYSESGSKISCTSNLKQIGLALRMYSNVYNETFPPYDGAKGLDLLRSESFLENPYVYKCPSTATSLPDLSKPLTEKNCDYIFFGGLSEASSVDIPLAMDKPGNHKGYRNVLFVDGHVKGYYNKEWKVYIKEYALKIPSN